jgi:hypothetical protein
MGILDKLMFWKKSDDLGLDENLGMGELGKMPGEEPLPPQPQQPGQQNYYASQPSFQQPAFQQPAFQQPQMESFQAQQAFASRDLEVVSAKLDALKATLESINQRLANIERIAEGEEEVRRRSW